MFRIAKTLEQTKVYHAVSNFVWKETIHKPLQLVVANTLFSSVFVIGTTCFDKCFLFHVITGRYCSSRKINVTLRFFKALCYATFFEASVLCWLWCCNNLFFLIFVTNFTFVTLPHSAGSIRRCQVRSFEVSGSSIRKNKLWIDFYTYTKSLYLQLKLGSLHFAGVLFKSCSEYISQTPMPKCDLDNRITLAWVLHIQACKN